MVVTHEDGIKCDGEESGATLLRHSGGGGGSGTDAVTLLEPG